MTVYSGYLPRPPVNCPSPGDPPPPRFSSTGGGPFTRGDFTLVDAREHLPAGAPAARVTRLSLALPRQLAGHSRATLKISARVCGGPGTALLRFTQASSPSGGTARWTRAPTWRAQLRHRAGCETHRISRLLDGFPGGRRYRVTLRARTTGRSWSRPVVRAVDAL